MPRRSASARTSAVHAARAAIGAASRVPNSPRNSRAAARPRGGRRQVGADPGAIGGRAPRGPEPGVRAGDPRRALVGEPEREVVVDRGDEVRVVRQPQRRQRGDHVARDGPGDHRALGVARADDAERLAQEPVPRRRGHRVVRLVAQLERQPRIGARVARRDPLPQREERRVRSLEVVHVEHDREASRQPALDRAVHALGRRRNPSARAAARGRAPRRGSRRTSRRRAPARRRRASRRG